MNNGARWIFTEWCLVIAALILGNRYQTSNYVSYSSYECGIFHKSSARIRYEITFYTIGLTYLMFELELLFIFPLLLSLQVDHKSFYTFILFLLYLLFDLLYEILLNYY